MSANQSYRLVIDASIARASGGEAAVHPTATCTRNFLLNVLEICHKAVMTPEIGAEWDRHQSSFARKWRRSMVARRKLIVIDSVGRDDLRRQIDQGVSSDNDKAAMLKDFHLVEAAIATDRRIVALDDEVRTLLSKESLMVSELRDVVWVNPVKNPIGTEALLKKEPQIQWTLESMG